MDDLEAKVRAIVARKMKVDDAALNDNTRFVDDLGADSLDSVELAMALEGEFHVHIDDDAADRLDTLKQTVDYLKSQMPTEEPASGQADLAAG